MSVNLEKHTYEHVFLVFFRLLHNVFYVILGQLGHVDFKKHFYYVIGGYLAPQF